jgi:hypothetical protein
VRKLAHWQRPDSLAAIEKQRTCWENLQDQDSQKNHFPTYRNTRRASLPPHDQTFIKFVLYERVVSAVRGNVGVKAQNNEARRQLPFLDMIVGDCANCVIQLTALSKTFARLDPLLSTFSAAMFPSGLTD